MPKRLSLLLLVLLLVLTSAPVLAAPARQTPDGEAYTVQAGDWLSKIAEKYYSDAQQYPSIIEATNAKAAQDPSFATINDPNLIEVGQKLWVPLQRNENALLFDNVAFQPVEISNLGLQTLVPADWPKTEAVDPLLQNTWSAGLFSLVSFAATPGNDTHVGLARLLRVPPESLANEAAGGQLIEEQFGDRTWAIFGREEGGITSVVAAMVEDKVIYQVSLFAETSQARSILTSILENFELIDPTATQQTITIDAPTAGTTLTNPFELRGSTSQYPFQGQLVYRVLDGQGNQVGRGPFAVVGQLGSSSTFAVPATYLVSEDGPGTIEVAEVSAADGTIIAIDSVGVNLLQDPPGYTIVIDDPLPFTSVSSPVEVRGKINDRPFEGRLNYRIVDAAGEELSAGIIESRGQVGQVNIYDDFAEFEVMRDGPGRIELYDIRPADGAVFSIASVNVWLTTPR
ncbi:MAG: LysM peptidoglycan-binding domain-containing protein [Anaerolineae bacterium]|nr:LysM peptidoglycan-binding domain-containing protein [Anaerolineae bacterium]